MYCLGMVEEVYFNRFVGAILRGRIEYSISMWYILGSRQLKDSVGFDSGMFPPVPQHLPPDIHRQKLARRYFQSGFLQIKSVDVSPRLR
jgi:hypothetical protein